MDQPSIQYTTTSDGVAIAFWTFGDGDLPLVLVPAIPWSDIQAEWADPRHRGFFQRLVRTFRLIRYDSRGSGSSDRNIPPFEDVTDALVLDIEAVVTKLNLEKFVLVGIAPGGPAAIRFAAKHPRLVSHLILWHAPARGQDAATPQNDALISLMQRDFTLFSETISHAMIAGWASSEDARAYAEFMRGSVDPDSPIIGQGFDPDYDLTDELQAIQCPTLVLHRKEGTFPGMAGARYIASRVAGSELVILEGGSLLPWVGDMEEVVRAIERFVGGQPAEGALDAPVSSAAAAQGLVTILFTDIEGSTTLTQRLGDDDAQEVVRAHNTIVRDALKKHAGAETKHTGDGVMASFPRATAAIEASIAIQRNIAEHNERAPERAFRVRIGLNAGEPVAEEDDLYGTAVQLAARVCNAAEPGAILCTDVVRQLAAGKGFLFADTGEVSLRGFEDPVRVYQVRWS